MKGKTEQRSIHAIEKEQGVTELNACLDLDIITKNNSIYIFIRGIKLLPSDRGIVWIALSSEIDFTCIFDVKEKNRTKKIWKPKIYFICDFKI